MNALLRTLTLCSLALPTAAEDVITLTDGSTIEGKVTEEALRTVSIKVDSKTQKVETEKILKVEYERKPQPVDEADTYASEGAVLDAIDTLQAYLEGLGDKGDRRFDWAPAYAHARIIELNASMGDLKAVVSAADALIKEASESRHVPMAFLTKAEAQNALGQKDKAQKTLNDFLGVIDEQGLSERWRLEVRLGNLVNDTSLGGSGLRDRLDELAAEAGAQYPTVRNKARVAIGESFLTGDSPQFSEAREVFEAILEDPKADDATLAGAHTGVGDCIFQVAASKVQRDQDASAELKAALKHYLRVVVVYPDENRYRPKALFFAGRSYQLLGEADPNSTDRARTLLTTVQREYPGSSWAAEAQRVQ